MSLLRQYRVFITRTADGSTREWKPGWECRDQEEAEWNDGSEFWWTEGNFGCDCNRFMEFERAGPSYTAEDEGRIRDEAICGSSGYRIRVEDLTGNLLFEEKA